MVLHWRIRYLDKRDRQFKDRDLWLQTKDLDPAKCAAVEACYDLGQHNHLGMLRFRELFLEGTTEDIFHKQVSTNDGHIGVFGLPDYLEDENGKQLTRDEMAVIVTGNPTAFAVPPGAKPHDIAYRLADKKPLDFAAISLDSKSLDTLGYFKRDLFELVKSSFFKNGPGSLTSIGDGPGALETAVSDEEIRSFVTIFRRLYMDSEPGSFQNASSAFVSATKGNAIGDWVEGSRGEYREFLNAIPDFLPMVKGTNRKPNFSRKLLLDVFIYTQYAHQPDKRRTQQFNECLMEVGNQKPLLAWLFLSQLHHCSLLYRSVGMQLAWFHERYCQCHAVAQRIIEPMTQCNPGIGKLEKAEDRHRRIIREKAEELARSLWNDAGSPTGGYMQYYAQALEKLTDALGNDRRHGN